MSSAALQSIPYPSTSVATNSAVTALSSGRPYTPGMSQPREGYFSPPNNGSPSSRRSSRRPSGGNSTPTIHNISQPHYRTTVTSPTPSSGSRTQFLSTSATGGVAEHSNMSYNDLQRGIPPMISPRTSSNRASHNSSIPADRSSSRRSGFRETSNSPRPTISSDGQISRERQRSNQNTPQSLRPSEERATATSRVRRRQTSQGDEASPENVRENRERKNAIASTARRKVGIPVRTHTSTDPPREASEVLNRIIISQPEVDIERERERMAEAMPASRATPDNVSSDACLANVSRGSRSRHDYNNSTSKREKSIKFGEYYLGGTLGEGEFGKVKMGWKQEGGVQVAIKLIRRDSFGTNPSRLAKIYREIAILREISHPNIVRLHEMVETEKQIGIILEYASGGELFDFILNNRYLKDNAARRLFAQLVSGVGYLHKKGIVHRDLKLENLLLDRNRNIIITDFGFANTFNADDELDEEIEYNLSNKDYVKKIQLDKILPSGHRRGDLMQTSCGSPCYAAPELVVSDSLYTGRKVDVWSCGVILYAMLAGYLPFDDDPANPEGDNINLLYKYIVSTPLTFPDYVSPHARDLLRRILVPDPRKRADLFEVARHSWLAEYAHVVNYITSKNTTSHEKSPISTQGEGRKEKSFIPRCASVREPAKGQKLATTSGELPKRYGKTDLELNEPRKTSKDNKRRTVQVEYVAPRSETQRGVSVAGNLINPISYDSDKRDRTGFQKQSGKAVSHSQDKARSCEPSKEKVYTTHGRRPSTANPMQNIPSQISYKEPPNPASGTVYHPTVNSRLPVSLTRPVTGESLKSLGNRPKSMHLTNRGSYSLPVAPELAGTNVQGRMAQPKSNITSSVSTVAAKSESGHSGFVTRAYSNSGKVSGEPDKTIQPTLNTKETKGHKRSNTIGGFFSRTNSVFGVGGRRGSEEKSSRKYPPVSMSGMILSKDEAPRPSFDSRRSISFGFGKKRSGSISNSQITTQFEKPRRFSLLPTTFSLKAIGVANKDGNPVGMNHETNNSERTDDDGKPPRTAQIRPVKVNSATGTTTPSSFFDGPYECSSEILTQNSQSANLNSNDQVVSSIPLQQQGIAPHSFRQGRASEPESSIMEAINNHRSQLNESQRSIPAQQTNVKGSNGRGVLQKNNRRFAEAYEQDAGNVYGSNDHAGSSGAARKVMDFFRRRGRDRGL